MNDPSMALGRGDDVKTLAGSGIRYLDKRTEFWRQQKPIYARVNEQKAARTARQTIKSTRNIHEIQRNTDRAVRMLTQADKRKSWAAGRCVRGRWCRACSLPFAFVPLLASPPRSSHPVLSRTPFCFLPFPPSQGSRHSATTKRGRLQKR